MTTIAFLGLGNMGGPMAANLVAAGHTVRGFDPMPAASSAAANKGVQVFGSGTEAVSEGDVVPGGGFAGSRWMGRCRIRPR